MSAEKPKALSLPPAPPRATVAGRPVMTHTLVGHIAPAPPEVTAWLNALLKLDGKPATPLGEALNVAHRSPTVPAFPAVVDVPELPQSALELEPPPLPPPPVAETAAVPPPLVIVEVAAAPPPSVVEAPAPLAEVPVASPPPVAAVEPPPPRVTPAAPIEDLDPDVDTAIVAGSRGRRRLVALALIGALGLTTALVVRGRHAPAPTTSAAPTVLVAPPIEAPPTAAAPAPSPHLELGLDPAGAAATQATAAPTPSQVEAAPQRAPDDEAPKRPRRERTTTAPSGDGTALQRGNALLKEGDSSGAVAAFGEAVRLSPDEPGGYRGLGLAHEQQGETAEAMEAFKRYIKLATRSRDREWAARHLYQLAHPEE